MKNNNIVNAMILIIVAIFFVIFQYVRFSSNTIDEKLYNRIWYKYNYNNGYYDSLIIEKNNIIYNKLSVNSSKDDYSNCSSYYFNKKNNSLALDCNKNIKIQNNNDNSLNIIIDNKINKFFDSLDETINYEFKSFFGKSIVEYKNDKLQAKEFIRINESKLKEIINSNDYSKIVFIGDKCTSVDCALALDVMEKWISTTEDVYYFDTNDLNDRLINYLSELNNKIENSINFYDNVYPIVIISKNGKVIDFYEIKCSGFNCSNYYVNEF